MAALDIYVLSFEAHFRLVTIHPWSDGNGRVARLVMNLVQMEGEVAPTIVRSDHKVRYIESLRASQEAGTPEPFLDFMTDELIDALAHDIDEYEHDLSRDVPWETFDPSTEPRSTPPSQETHKRPWRSGAERERDERDPSSVGRKSFRQLYLREALDSGLIEMTIPDRPRSSNQRYRLTKLGMRLATMD